MDRSASLREVILSAGLLPTEVGQFIGYNPKHWRRMLDGKVPTPPRAWRLVAVLAGALGVTAPAWDGWTLDRRSGALLSPEGEAWTPERFRALHWHHEQLAEERARLRAEIATLRAALAATRETLRPHPELKGRNGAKA